MIFELVSITSPATKPFLMRTLPTYLPHKVYFIKPVIQQHEQLTIHSTRVFAWGVHKNIKEQEKLKNGAGELKPCWRHAEQTGTIESWGAVSNLYYWAQCLDSKENRWLCNMEMAPWKAVSTGMLQQLSSNSLPGCNSPSKANSIISQDKTKEK